MFTTRWRTWRQGGETAFWWVAPRALVVAVMTPSVDEPVLRRCAGCGPEVSMSAVSVAAVSGSAVSVPRGSVVPDSGESLGGSAAGLLEMAELVGCQSLPNVIGLATEWTDLLRIGEPSALGEDGVLRLPLAGAEGWDAEVLTTVLEKVLGRFAAAGLHVARVDTALVAAWNVAEALGEDCSWLDRADTVPEPVSHDPLGAVLVAPEAEATALELGHLLEVPVGLALGLWGGGAGHARL